MKRKVISALIVLVGAVWLGATGWEAYKIRPVDGRLTADLTAGEYTAGLFTIHWDPAGGGAFYITHADFPKRALWQTLPGVAFVGAAQGQEMVDEARGSFFIEDRRTRTCAEQQVWSVASQADAVIVTGLLICAKGETSEYFLTF